MKTKIMLMLMSLVLIWIVSFYMLNESRASEIQIDDPALETALMNQLQVDSLNELTDEDLRQITSLDLSNSTIKSLRGIEKFAYVNTLDVSNNHIENIEPLLRLRRLVHLNITNNEVKSIDGIEQLGALESLSAAENRVSDTQSLKRLSRLLTLDLADNQISYIDPISSLLALETLNINGNNVTDISPLSTLDNLVALDASYNFIQDFSPLQQIASLREELYIEGNPFVSLDSLEGFYLEIANRDWEDLSHQVVPSVRGGKKEQEVSVELSIPTESDAAIYYTLDGSTPDENSSIYQEPIVIEDSTVLTAKAISSTGVEGDEIRETYLFNTMSQLPVVSVSTDPRNLFDEEIGIYVPGVNMNPRSGDPASTGNYAMTGREWERPIKLEYFDESGELTLSQQAGIRIHGGASRGYDRKSFRLYARSDYGKSTFNYPFFGEEDHPQYKRLLLRNSGNDYNHTLFRDGYLQTLVKGQIDIETQNYEPAVLYVNGEYWGIYNIRERYDADYFEDVKGIDPGNLDFLDNNGQVVNEGRNAQYLEVQDYIRNNDLSEDEHYEQISKWIDIDNFIDYNLIEIFVRNTDWPGNNRSFYRDRGGDGLWRWVIYDLDFGFGRFGGPHAYRHHSLAMATEAGQDSMPNPDWSTLELRSLLENDHFREEFIGRMSLYLDTVFHPSRTIPMLEEMAQVIEPEMPKHIERWEKPESIERWNGNVNGMRQFAEERPAYILAQFAQFFDRDGVATLNISASLREQIEVNGKSLDVEGAAGDRELKWLTNTPMQLTYQNEKIELRADDEGIASIEEGTNTVRFMDEGETVLYLISDSGQELGSIDVQIEHYEKERVTLEVGDTYSIGQGAWLTSDETVMEIADADAVEAVAIAPGKSLLTRKQGEDIIQVVEVEVTE
ncbi:CotH kinase family protein [Alkalihalophilus lindianensis]|uniref:CotH kinase family protein n=1 Tax=Alkalihalophilus lindianensis TaxID=1630542 RepID=A0ABU3X8X2_9BACI|nr:CotH kinase family protein [Alkalihalophilus lindianensis]MDV2684335.1 CotH kinase family protein [Alkalihalophilus lindianensis]